MSLSPWPQLLAKELAEKYDFKHPILAMKAPEVESFLRKSVAALDVSQFVRAMSPLIADEEDDSEQEIPE